MTESSRLKREAFGQKMTDILNCSAINLAMAIGYRTGLFEVMASFSIPQTVEAISLQAGLNERYVREWLGIMFTGKIIELSEGEDKKDYYLLPPEHASMLTRSAGNTNLAVYTQEIPLLTKCAMEEVIHSFQNGAGVPYSCYPLFQAFMSELANAKHRQVLLEKFLPSVENGNLIARLKKGIRVCDIGCGEGVATLLMAEAFPKSFFIGIDIDDKALSVAKNAAAKPGLKNIDFYMLDAADIRSNKEWTERFDYITAFDSIHDQRAPLDALVSIYAILAPNGLFSMVDIAAHTSHCDNCDHPMGPFLYTVSLMHCMPVGLFDGGVGLGMMWGREQAAKMLQKAGFINVKVEEIPEDPFNLHFCCRKE